ncbi:MAG: chromosome segregation protein, partial [Bacteroidota bacterium]
MRLKSLEIKGFKSFADKTVLNFDEGITGVIGPNGCGKSNIIDSIRWVIGEHKISNLRSENLESLVFNGSKTRNASGLAEVSLTFENTKNLLPTEFNTVTITRKYYKSGESEYRLNDVSCRLKDIHNLFMDTGVSTDSYAIIELGMVDDIIKDKENSRRKMLEQAAGITIYKTRKKEAKLKLDAAEQDLARIEDLLFEINNQLKTLESQAKKAEKYYEIKKEYKEISIELAKAALEGFNVTYRDLNQQQQQEVDKRIELETAIAKEEAALEQERVAFIEKEKELQQLQQAFNETLDQVRQKENDKNLAAQKLQHLNERKINLDDFLKKAEGQVAGLNESILFTGNQVEEEKQKMTDLEAQLQSFKSDVEGKRKTFDDQRVGLDQLRRSFQLIQKSQFEAEKKVAVADTGIQNILRSLQQLEEEKLQREKSIAEILQDKDAKSLVLESSKLELAQMQEEQDRLKAQILEAQQALEGMRQVLAEENRKLDSRKNEYDLLKSLVDSMEGYPESVKFLHKNSNWGKQAPLLSDIIYVKEEYRAAVENVLEPFLNYYVVECLQDGIKAIQLLDQNKKGKANFFVMDRLKKSDITTQPSSTIKALDVVEVDEIYMPLASHLLGNVFIALDETALEVESDAVILEKSGKMVKGKYALSGGSVGLFEGKKIGRAKNLEKMFADIQEQESIVKAKKDEIQQKHDQVLDYNSQLKEQAIRQLSQKINDLSNQVFVLQNKADNLSTQNKNAETRISDLNQNMSTQQEAIATTREELIGLNENLFNLQDQIQKNENDYNEAEKAYNEASTAYNNANLMLTRQQSKISSLQQEFDFKTNQLQSL